MKNTFGNALTLTLFGESHGDAIGCVLDGVSPGIKINMPYIRDSLEKRAARDSISTDRREPDAVEILSGVKDGYTEGTPIVFLIKNYEQRSDDYSPYASTPRPSHADYSQVCKYSGFADLRGGGHSSGRLTAPIVAAGALVRHALLQKGIKIGSHIKQLSYVDDEGFGNIDSDIELLSRRDFPTLSELAEERMIGAMIEAKDDFDSLGGIIECAAVGIPAGIGEPWFDTVEGMLAHAMLSIPGIKGIEFGMGFDFATLSGSEARDELMIEDGRVVTRTNNNGGVNGGITNGMPITFSLAVKPTPSIGLSQRTVDLKTMTDTEITIRGRHDSAIIRRACPVVDALCALVIGDFLITKFGSDALK